MNFVLERDGLAACPDDRARTDTPEPSINMQSLIDGIAMGIEDAVFDVLRGREEYAYIGAERFDKDELFELITENGDPAEMLLAMCSKPPFSGTSSLGDRLIHEWSHRKATELAEKELL